jgi:hypothetical protein
MIKRPVAYVMLVGFAAVMVFLLMFDDPAAKQAELVAANATQQAQRPAQLFPNVSAAAQVYGIEVLDVTTGTGVLLVRNEQGLWYAPEILDRNTGAPIQEYVAADAVNQSVAESAALSLAFMATKQWYQASPRNLRVFGLAVDTGWVATMREFVTDKLALFELSSDPQYVFQFTTDPTGSQGHVAQVGNANLDDMAYYVWPEGDQRIYLVSNTLMDPLLSMLTETFQSTTTPSAEPSG